MARVSATARNLWLLFVASFAALYVELLLIRWVGTEVRIFAYFQNLTLIACFLGFGLGCYWSERPKNQMTSLAAIAALVALVRMPLAIWQDFLASLSNLLSLSPDAAQWGVTGLAGGRFSIGLFLLSVVAMAVLLILVVAAMVPLGQWVGYCLNRAPNPIRAYSINLLGSVAGIWVLAGMAFLWLPPAWWFLLAFGVVLLVRRPSTDAAVSGLVLMVAVVLLVSYPRGSNVQKTYWSPYQKLELVALPEDQYSLLVNNTRYMSVANLTPQYLADNTEVANRYQQEGTYDAPFRFARRADRVLILGAGAGNDAAGALRNGAQHIDAVEIDPVILELGKQLHRERPYQSPRVRTVIEDARTFLRETRQEYDVILFGLLDSHTQFSDYSNMRLDNYVYTREAFQEARRLLKPDGVLVVKFEVRDPWTWMGARFYTMMGEIFGRPPLVFHAPPIGPLVPATVFITSDDESLWVRASRGSLGAHVASHPPPFDTVAEATPLIPTDDWPYMYHRDRSIPRTYLTVSVVLLGLAVVLMGGVVNPRSVSTWQFFLLGAGFFSLQTQMISRLALYFGSTWLVNCVAITAILLMLVAANVFVARHQPARLGGYFVALIVSLLANFLVPWTALGYGPSTTGWLLCFAYAVPVFFAGVVFAELFRRSPVKSSVFGANIMGAVAGGLAQNLSFIVGLKALLLVAAACYATTAILTVFPAGWAQLRRSAARQQTTSVSKF